MFKVDFDVEKSVTVARPPAEVFQAVADFGTWRRWSPWLSQEPSCPVTVEGDPGQVGHRQSWDGDFIGSGSIALATVEQGSRLDYELTFLKPWKSQSKAGFRLAPDGEGTKISWWMQGNLPVFMFFMKPMMTAFVGSDYSRGLSMLKELLETGDVATATDVSGVVQRPALPYVGRRRSCSLADIGPAMEEDFTILQGLVQEAKLPQPKEHFSIYHTFDMVKDRCEYTSGFVLDGPLAVVDGLVEGLVSGHLPEHRALQVVHRGPYRHLGNAWSAAMGCSRSKHKLNKAVPMYEVYRNTPQAVAENELVTEVYVPVKPAR
jgi:uncharacterized protein YndB with AHSA1/START domain/DNA gyrase inhibitor GyrI